MKECPQCHAVTFDDMRVCYGCLHAFDVRERDDPTVLDAVVLPLPPQMSVLPAGTVISQCSARDGSHMPQGGSEDRTARFPDGLSAVPSAQRTPGGKSTAASEGVPALAEAHQTSRTSLDRLADLHSLADIDLGEADLSPEEFCLCVDEGTGRVERHPFGVGRSLVVGRSHGCDVELRDPMASRRHLQVEAQDGQVVLSDLGSSNPTYVDGLPLEGKAVAALGACITIARAKLWAERAQGSMGLAARQGAAR